MNIDLYAFNSNIREWHSGFKIIFAFVMTILAITLDNPYVSIIIIIAMAYIIVWKGGLGVKAYLSVLKIPVIFILLSGIAIAVDFPLSASMESIMETIFLMLKVFAAVSGLQMMILSTLSSDIIMFFKSMHVPKLIIELMNLIYRFIFILFATHGQMKNAAMGRQGYVDFKTSCRTFGAIASNVFIISIKGGNACYDAMESRCYEGDLQFIQEEKNLNWKHIFIAAIFITFLFAVWILTK